MSIIEKTGYSGKLILLVFFSLAFAFVEAAVVVYLREIVYPEGFAFPLKTIPVKLIAVELIRELATIVMLVTVATSAGSRLGERFGFFLIVFGIWDIFYYVWLKVAIDWPSSLAEFDILFLIPVPWIGPVLAPVLISVLMVICGVLITRLYAQQKAFRPGAISWVFALIGTAAILFSFMRDTEAAFQQQMPEPYQYFWLIAGLVLYIAGFALPFRDAKRRF
ncbi:MAG: hypothetical protein JSV52_12370 [Candidatus Zixiibacteriota bacterium]|nr:MAG: hypothetical protein JSV52_12370 [candidate division Zixibacteria bacterium]